MAVQIHHSQLDGLVTRLVYARAGRFGRLARLLLQLVGVDVPGSVRIGCGLQLVHATTGLVLHPETLIGDRVALFHGVTVGRGDPWIPLDGRGPAVVELGDDVILGAGATVLASAGEKVTVGAGTIVGSNAVLTHSTGAWEVWAGNPARKVGDRPPLS